MQLTDITEAMTERELPEWILAYAEEHAWRVYRALAWARKEKSHDGEKERQLNDDLVGPNVESDRTPVLVLLPAPLP